MTGQNVTDLAQTISLILLIIFVGIEKWKR